MLERLYDAYAPRLYPYVLSLVRNREDAEDVMQDLFVKLSKRGAALGKVQDMDAYLFAAARNEALRALRRRRPRRSLVELDLLAAPENPGSPAEAAAALEALPPEQAEVVFLKVFEELTFKQIGEALGVSQDTAASRYRYAMEKLRS
jgi:RNA polymerase sigma-70 factor (ECF subfamily)